MYNSVFCVHGLVKQWWENKQGILIWNPFILTKAEKPLDDQTRRSIWGFGPRFGHPAAHGIQVAVFLSYRIHTTDLWPENYMYCEMQLNMSKKRIGWHQFIRMKMSCFTVLLDLKWNWKMIHWGKPQCGASSIIQSVKCPWWHLPALLLSTCGRSFQAQL